MKVAVVGAGIGGLCVSVGLQRYGADVTVFERSDQVRAAGSGLSVFGNGLRALESLGLRQQFEVITSPHAATYRSGQRRPDGRWLATIPPDAVTDLRIVHRTDLHTMLLARVQPGTIRCSTEVISVRSDGTVLVREVPGSSSEHHFDLVVVADGLFSNVRARWAEDPGVRYAGYSAWRGVTSAPVDLRGEAGETWGEQTRFGIAPLADGRVYWFGVATTPRRRSQSASDEYAELKRLFGTWHSPVPELIDTTDPETISFLPIDELAGDLPSYRHGRCVLLGDAAHAMTPNLGQGGGQAMEDAATLAALLSLIAAAANPDERTINSILDSYDEARRPRTQALARRSRRLGTLAHVRGRGRTAVRNLLLQNTPPSTLRAQLRRTQDWHPPVAGLIPDRMAPLSERREPALVHKLKNTLGE
ncbi:FAD-dependent monooxygenase [Williamsia sp. D3]|uniref:FAD-dependent monooxygenase n=1 Tax=Williamsia sp. D3 TaxID=1313067 RepID=UPI0003D2C736|nr:FAD-dependent monooxygenase [Williamsia sp. D3]ETD33925.1 oxidoreductase [Williamsia sp. D3]